jgi:hypothetical protein
MKKLAVLVILAMVVAVPAYAQLGDVDNSSFVIQNLGTMEASVTVTFYDELGAAVTPNPILPGTSGTCADADALPNPFPLGANGAKQEIYMPNVCGLADGRYSVVIEATEPLGVIANLIGDQGGGATFYNGSYSGFPAGDMNVYFPSTQHNFYGWYSLISIQNVSGSAIDATLHVYDEDGVEVDSFLYEDIPAFSSVHVDFEADPLGLADMLNGSAMVACTGACVAVDNQTAAGGFTQSYNGFLVGGQTLFAPALYTSYYTWGASLKVQNIGGVATDIAVTYMIEGGGTCAVPAETIQPNQALYHYLPDDWAVWGCASATDKIVGAKVTSTDTDVVAVSNAANPAGQAQTYGGFVQTQGAAEVGLPVIMNKYYDWDTAFVCQNVSDAGTATLTYSYAGLGCPSGPVYAGCQFTLAPGEAKSVYQPDDLDANTGLFAATVTATGANIACIANETMGPGQSAGTGDWSMSYNGFTQ